MYYVRADSAAQEPPYSDLEQMLECRSAIMRYGLAEVGGRCDVVGPRTRWRDRPGLQEVIQEARHDRFRVLVARSLNRLSCRGSELRVLLNDLACAGVIIVTLREGILQPLPIASGLDSASTPARAGHDTAETAGRSSALKILPEDVRFACAAYAAGASLDQISETLNQRRAAGPAPLSG